MEQVSKFMLYQCSFKISHVKRASILELWPFGIQDLERLLIEYPFSRKCFIAIKHPRWPDGFHPPAKKLLAGKANIYDLIASLNGTAELIEALQKPAFDTVVDLKIYFPDKPLATKSKIAYLEKIFEKEDEVSSFKAWGGCWIHIHDACKTYVTFPLQSTMLNKFFVNALQTSGAQIERQEIAILCDKLNSISDSECLIVSWFRDVVYYRIEDADIHNYEKICGLFSGNSIKLRRADCSN
jgi:hypothetical protein